MYIHRLFKVLVSMLVLSWSLSVSADPYSDGVDSAINGDYKTAFSKWLPLAQQGDARAQFNLALLYHGALDQGFDEARAVYWYQKAAHNGVREAQEYMVVGYREGWFGLPRDKQLAGYWRAKLEQSN